MQIKLRLKAWRDQATGAVQSRSLLRTSSKGQIVSVDAIRGHGKSQQPRSRPKRLTASGPSRSSPEAPPEMNTHRQRAGQRFCVQSILGHRRGDQPSNVFQAASGRDAGLKMLCTMWSE